MGIGTVAIHSEADRGALHVGACDRAVAIAGDPVRAYLDIAAIVAAAEAAAADAVHPGYGFLSENADLAEACDAAGLVFVGPSAQTIRAMSDKARARAAATAAGVPVVPGIEAAGPGTVDREAVARLGLPVMIKAAFGGGGRGMRRVERLDDLEAALDAAAREAEASFGDGALLVEKLVEAPRHIEVQVFGDRHGGLVHLGERDCSIQRRHQKIIEETPSGLAPDRRAAICADALRLAASIGYVGAGTVEFILDDAGAHYFLEMNTRLQVEHPVTEAVTGIDLVEWQLRVAVGEPLPRGQEAIRFEGHAIEARLCAEDPAAGFLPQTGTVLHWRPDISTGQGLRVDNGVAEGATIPPFYDSLVAKVIAHGASREEAATRLQAALRDLPLLGVATNRGFLIDLLGRPEFRQRGIATDTIDGWLRTGHETVAPPRAPAELVALAAWLRARGDGDWFRSSGVAACPVTLDAAGRRFETLVNYRRGVPETIEVDGAASDLSDVTLTLHVLRYVFDGGGRVATAVEDGRTVHIDRDGLSVTFLEPDPLSAAPVSGDPYRIRAPVSGLVRAVTVRPGDRVKAGDPLAVVEAMKMETVLRAPTEAVVESLGLREGAQVKAGDLAVTLSPDEPAAS